MLSIRKKNRFSPFVKNIKKNKSNFNSSDLTIHDFHRVFKTFPELEQKYLNIMKLPITGKEAIDIPFDFVSYHQHTCLDLSPYGNEQISKSACIKPHATNIPTASDSIVAFMNQSINVMQHRIFYYGFKKNIELFKLSVNQPALFQIFYIIYNTIPSITPIIFSHMGRLSMHIIFETKTLHLPCDCINQILSVSHGYQILLDIKNDILVLTILYKDASLNNLKIDITVLQRKIEEMEIPNDINEKYERYKTFFVF